MPAQTPDQPPSAQHRSRSSRRADDHTSAHSERPTPTYGYHNTFHTHAQLPFNGPPPSYDCANSPQTLSRLAAIAQAERAAALEPLPSYTCSVEISGILALKQELSSPFTVVSNKDWNDVYVSLRGTQLQTHRIKQPNFLSKTRLPAPGRVVKTFSLQHAEVGLAADFKKTALVPRSPFAHLMPASAHQKLFESDPHLFEPVREYVIRLRLETEQFLLCAATQEEMLDWLESLCAAIDISQPLEDRSDPRYRSLPRRSRRQRLLDSSRLDGNLENLSHWEAGRQFIAEQERIIRQLYPHLAAPSATEQPATGQAERIEQASAVPTPGADPETDDLDPDDARFPASRTASRDGTLARTSSIDRPSSSASTSESSDPKSSPPCRHSPGQALRYRRRCAPVLLACSPRVSEVVFSNGKRMRINVKEHILQDYLSQPPRYDAHHYPRQKPFPSLPEGRAVPQAKTLHAAVARRPNSPSRADSDDSLEPFGYDLSAATSGVDEIRSVPSSEPPSPTAATHAKVDAAHRLAALGKTRSSEEGTRDDGLGAVTIGVGLLL